MIKKDFGVLNNVPQVYIKIAEEGNCDLARFQLKYSTQEIRISNVPDYICEIQFSEPVTDCKFQVGDVLVWENDKDIITKIIFKEAQTQHPNKVFVLTFVPLKRYDFPKTKVTYEIRSDHMVDRSNFDFDLSHNIKVE